MRWFKFFLTLFILSAVATGATYYWKTYYPAERAFKNPAAPKKLAKPAEPSSAAPVSSGEVAGAAPGSSKVASADEQAVTAAEENSSTQRNINMGSDGSQTSQTQDLANMLSIVSSVVSLVGTLISLVVAMGFRRRASPQ